jgi:hypothetical protein
MMVAIAKRMSLPSMYPPRVLRAKGGQHTLGRKIPSELLSPQKMPPISSRKSLTGWKRPLEDPIPLPRGRQLVTLQDAADYIMKLSKADRDLPEWQAAGRSVDDGGGRSRAAAARACGYAARAEPRRRESIQLPSQGDALGKAEAEAE